MDVIARRWLPSLFVASLCAASLAGQEEAEAEKLVAEAKQRLAAVGYDVPAGVATSSRTAAQVIADLDVHQELLFPRGAYALQHALLSALGLKAGKDEKALRQQTLAAMARGIAAYYDPAQKTFVLLPSAARSVNDAFGGSLALVVHELAHASQDAREGGIAAFFDAERLTLDLAQARRCILEGEAELAAVLALRGEAAVADLTIDSGAFDKAFAGELTGLLYQLGRRAVAARFLADGRPGVAAMWRAAPSSTEQVLHPTKLGKDLPTPTEVPPLPGCEPLHTTTWGELMTYHVLRQIRLDTTAAMLAAAGWDGDQVAVLRHDASKAQVVAWRSVWDRDEDAAQFAKALPVRRHSRVLTQGRVVDWLHADDADDVVLDGLLEALRAKVPELPKDAEAAAGTAAVEGQIRAEAARTGVSGGRWRHEALGLSMPVPEGFELREMQGMKMLVLPATQKQGFLVNVNVVTQARGELADVQAMLDVNKKQFEPIDDVSVDTLELGKVGEVDVVHCEWHGRIPGMVPIHCLQVLYLRGDQQVIVTATTAPSQWKTHEAALRAVMAGITIAP